MPTLNVSKSYEVTRGPVTPDGTAMVFHVTVAGPGGTRHVPFLRLEQDGTWKRLDTGAVIATPPAVLTTLATATGTQQAAIDNVLANATVQAVLAGML
jgi:hypothetical protein